MHTSVSTALVVDPGQSVAQHVQVLSVDFGLDSMPLSAIDQEREWLIQAEGLLMQVEMSIWARTSDMGAHGAATSHHTRMLELIKGRSPTVRARMAQERGLPHA